MKLPITIHDTKHTKVAELQYLLAPARHKQKRLQSRNIATPDIDLTAYESRAVVDWIDIDLSLIRQTQFQHIKKHADRCTDRSTYTNGRDVGPGNVSDHFVLRLQEPDFKSVLAAMRSIEDVFGFKSTPEITGMEVSLDFRPKVPSDMNRARIFSALFHQFFVDPIHVEEPLQGMRFTFGKKDNETVYVLGKRTNLLASELSSRISVESDRRPTFGSTVYYGQRDPSFAAWRLMDKVKDQQNKTTGQLKTLNPEEYRVRLEVTLGVDGLKQIGVSTLTDLNELSFQSLAGAFFKFRLATFAAMDHLPLGRTRALAKRRERDRQHKFTIAGVTGLQIMDEAKNIIRKKQRVDMRKHFHLAGISMKPEPRSGIGDNGSLVNWDHMAGRVTQALRRLEVRVRREFGVKE